MPQINRVVAIALVFWVSCIAVSAELPRRADLEGWSVLFDGKSLDGWQQVGEATWKVVDGSVSTPGEKPGWLMTTSKWTNFDLHVEFQAPAATNSGIFLRSALEPTDPTMDCYELNIAPQDNPFPSGALVGRSKPEVQLNVWDGRWHMFDVRAEGATISIHCDDKQVLEYTDPNHISGGHIGLQSKAGPVAFRSVSIREIRRP